MLVLNFLQNIQHLQSFLQDSTKSRSTIFWQPKLQTGTGFPDLVSIALSSTMAVPAFMGCTLFQCKISQLSASVTVEVYEYHFNVDPLKIASLENIIENFASD